jgi:two-component system phosphate regulon response regulator OmpR
MADILIADDSLSHRTLAQFVLETQGGHSVRAAASTPGVLAELEDREPDVLVLDVAPPDQLGLDLCRRIRRKATLPILMVSARGAADDRVQGLRAGADDFLPKPFDPVELVERVNALLRRTRRFQVEPQGASLRAGDFRLHLIDRVVWIKDRGPIELTPIECRLLYALLSRPGGLWTREELAGRLWDTSAGYAGPTTAVEAHISRLRRKLERCPRRPLYLHTVRGEGYQLRTTLPYAR